MTAKVDLSRESYLYAQAIDNCGDTEYWRVESLDGPYEQLGPTDARLSTIRDSLDAIQAYGRDWPIGTDNLSCRVALTGECVITVRPLTLDAGGRVSPVLLLLNVLASGRRYGARALPDIQTVIEREIAESDRVAIAHIVRLFRCPRWFLFLHIALFSRRSKSD